MSTRGLIQLLIAAAFICAAVPPIMAQTPPAKSAMIEDFKMQPETRWRVFHRSLCNDNFGVRLTTTEMAGCHTNGLHK